MGTLYVVATPIGNLADITLRALDVLRTVDVVACEDTRRTRALLSHFGIHKRLVSCRAHNEAQAARRLIHFLSTPISAFLSPEKGRGRQSARRTRARPGETVGTAALQLAAEATGEQEVCGSPHAQVAYVSDAGTPGVSDPGAVLVRAVRDAGHTVVPIPGASALTTLLSVAGVRDKTVLFEGFLSPHPCRRRARLVQLCAQRVAFVLYESPYRVQKLLEDLVAVAPESQVVLGRELTKVHEELCVGTALRVMESFCARTRVRGECVLLVSAEKF